LTGAPVSTRALVLSAIRLAKPSTAAFFARDADSLNKSAKFTVTLNQTARLTWRIVNTDGEVVRTFKSRVSTAAGTLAFVWNGRTDSGAWAPDGVYRSVVRAETDLGSYTQERSTYVGAFRITPSVSSPTRGGKVTLTIASTETLSGAPMVTITQPGSASQTVVADRIATRKYRVTVTLASSGASGSVDFLVSGTDRYGGDQETLLSLPLR
jgi:hypothetical protein